MAKVKSTWDYDNKLQQAQRIADVDGQGLSMEEEIQMYRDMGLPTIENERPRVKIPYSALVDYLDMRGR